MRPLINFKVCDNSPECDAVAVCPTKAIIWDEGKKTLSVISEKCIGCQKCVSACPVGAIKFAATIEDENRIIREFEEEAAQVGELFIDRYGATPIGPNAGYKESEIDLNSVLSDGISVIELIDPENMSCLRASIPIKRLFSNDVYYSKALSDESEKLQQEFGITTLPALLIFKGKKFLGKIQGSYDIDNEADLADAIKKIIS
ncbi:MAG: 4Fe-4S binding protein [Parcubacteria group bacterium]